MTELKGDGRIPTATDERERAGFERAVREEWSPNGAPPARAPFGRIGSDRRERGRGFDGKREKRGEGRDNNAKYGRKEE